MTDHTDLIAELREEAAAMIVHGIEDDTSARAADALELLSKELAETYAENHLKADAIDRWINTSAEQYQQIHELTAQLAVAERQRDSARSAQIARGDVFADTNPGARWIEDMANACLACGGSGHKDDMKQIYAGIDWSGDAIADAERRGAERMRERAQQVVWGIQERNYTLAVAMTVSKAIRALPLTEGGE